MGYGELWEICIFKAKLVMAKKHLNANHAVSACEVIG